MVKYHYVMWRTLKGRPRFDSAIVALHATCINKFIDAKGYGSAKIKEELPCREGLLCAQCRQQ